MPCSRRSLDGRPRTVALFALLASPPPGNTPAWPPPGSVPGGYTAARCGQGRYAPSGPEMTSAWPAPEARPAGTLGISWSVPARWPARCARPELATLSKLLAVHRYQAQVLVALGRRLAVGVHLRDVGHGSGRLPLAAVGSAVTRPAALDLAGARVDGTALVDLRPRVSAGSALREDRRASETDWPSFPG